MTAGTSGVGTITKFDATQFATRIAGEVQRLRSAAVHREERRQEDGRLHPVRDCRRAVRDGRRRLDGHAREQRRASACSSRRASAGSRPSSASTRRCSRAARARSPRSSSRRRSSTSRPARCRSASARKGPNSATCTACSASAHAIGDAFEIILRGDADVMIAGGSEAAITPMGIGGFGALRALSTRNDDPARASRPFDKDRDGFIVGEGAGVRHPRGATSRPGAAARGSTPSSSATACRPTRITSPRRRRTATARSA